MRLYAGSSSQFIEDTTQNQIAGKLRSAFEAAFRYSPGQSEQRSWRESLRAMGMVITSADLDDHGVILEYQLPMSSKRLDFMIMGRDEERDRAVIVELKQWEKCAPSDGDRLLTWVGGGNREVAHPSVQVGQYSMYLKDGHESFYEGPDPVALDAVAYLHNYSALPDDPLWDIKFSPYLEEHPVFDQDEVPKLLTFLSSRLSQGRGMEVMRRVEGGRLRPSKTLMGHVASVIEGRPEYVLLDEQVVAFDKVLACARRSFHSKEKMVLIIRGGPGTGKSVIAINLMGKLLKEHFNAHYVTGSKAFTETLRKIIGARGAPQFRYSNSYMVSERDEVDVLICDEAHRIRATSTNRFTPKAKITGRTQIEELLHAGRVAVFLLDDDQIVRPYEVGSVDLIRDAAKHAGQILHEFELETQFRCAGSDGFVNWVDNTLGIKKTANVLWTGHEGFDFQILPGPNEVDAAIHERATQGASVRMVAGYCWPWSDPQPDGTLVSDVRIGTYAKPWNARQDAGKLAKGIPASHLWAHDPAGIEQVGCVYTAQGFEFDYVGVIFGKDLVYNFDRQEWVGVPAENKDTALKRGKEQFADLLKNTYRVLLSRGLKGCYVCFLDKDTERFVRSRIESETPPQKPLG